MAIPDRSSLRSSLQDWLHHWTYRAARRVVVAIVGATLLVVGVILIFTPGPAIVVLTLGLAVLSAEFAWARRWLHSLKSAAGNAVDRVRGTSRSDPPQTEPPPS